MGDRLRAIAAKLDALSTRLDHQEYLDDTRYAFLQNAFETRQASLPAAMTHLLAQLPSMATTPQVSWWKELDVPGKLPYARDRIVECCFWILAVYFEPQYSQARKIMTKVIATLSITDDTYDAYGTIDELELLTEAIERWDISCLDDLPECMKLPYKLLIKVYEEIEQEATKEGRPYCVNYGIKEV
ncbi:Germacrene D synthase [Spatholobus suberectus]|nr:Germacrene D synthase [Spatholobus suberectus]